MSAFGGSGFGVGAGGVGVGPGGFGGTYFLITWDESRVGVGAYLDEVFTYYVSIPYLTAAGLNLPNPIWALGSCLS